jgi:L-threonylcarbamoyladenylate synthase
MNQSQISTDVNEAAQILLSGGIIGLPTETVYGLAACALNQSAVSKVFAVKGRPTSHPLIVHLRPEEDLTMWGVFTPDALRLARAFWPGPLTLLVERTKMVPDWVTGGRDTVALRVPSHPVAIALLQAVNTGLVAPSANKFGKVSPTTAQHVLDDLGDSVDLILDGGSCEVGVESTIVECLEDSLVLLRPGAISAEQIQDVVEAQWTTVQGVSRAPGMLASHYTPDAVVVLVDGIEEAQQYKTKQESDGGKVAIIHHQQVDEYARKLYDDLRDADNNACTTVVAVMPPDEGLGAAIRDRLRKAANR